MDFPGYNNRGNLQLDNRIKRNVPPVIAIFPVYTRLQVTLHGRITDDQEEEHKDGEETEDIEDSLPPMKECPDFRSGAVFITVPN